MNRLKSIFKEKGFRSLLKRNFVMMLAILLIPTLLIFIILLVVSNQFQYNTLSAQADSSLLRIETQANVLFDSMRENAFSIHYADLTSSFSRHFEHPLSSQKFRILPNLQDSLRIGEQQGAALLFQSSDSSYLVTQQIATTLHKDLALPSYTYQYQRLLALSQSVPTGMSVSYMDEMITFCSHSIEQNGIGVFAFVEIQKASLASMFTDLLPSGGRLFLISPEGNFIVGSAPHPAFDSALMPYVLSSDKRAERVHWNGQYYLLSTRTCSIGDWKYVQLLPISDFIFSQRFSLGLFFTALVAVLAGGIFVSLGISMRLYYPIQIVMQLLQNPQQGNMDYYRTYCQKYDDMDMILTLIESSEFQKMAISSKLEKQNRILQQAQNYAMAVQMNPHFIFNTLDCINWRIMALQTGDKEITSAISDFSKIMRYALKQKGLVPLMEEMNIARIYIRLRNTLSTSKILVSWDIDEAVPSDATVPFLILQPLLENAITHGLKEAESIAQLQIRCYVSDEFLVLEVEDNGVGFTQEKLAQVQEMLRCKTIPEDAGHIGLLNTHNRIRLSYGDEFGLQVSSKPGRTIVSARMPAGNDHPLSVN